MKNRYQLLFTMLAVIALMSSCTKTIRMTSSPSGDVVQNGYLEFQFSEPLAPKDSVGVWTRTTYIEFDPPAVGTFQWKNPTTLAFFPAEPLMGATKYTAKPTQAILFGESGHVSENVAEFHTHYFAVTNLRTTWADYSSYDTKQPIGITLTFNYPVEPDALREHLEIYRNGEKVLSPYIYGWSAEPEYEIKVDVEEPSSDPQVLKVILKKGLVSTLGYGALASDLILQDTLMPMANLEITSATQQFNNGHYEIKVQANQGLSKTLAASFISLVPNMPFDIETSGKDLIIRADFRPGGMYTVDIRKGLPGMAGGESQTDFTTNITFPGLQPFLRFSDNSGIYLMRNGFENINVKSVNLSYIHVNLYEIYENNLIHFINNNHSSFRRHGGWWDDEDDYYYGYRYGYLTLDDFGALISSDTIRLGKPKDNEINDTPLHLQKKMRSKIQGIYAIEITNSEHEYEEDFKVISLSDIGLIAKWSDDELIVFANYLSTARPAAGARVNLISSTNQVIQSGTADASGVVRFAKATYEANNHRFWPRLVTVANGSDFNFLDLDRTEVDKDRFDIEGKEKTDYEIYCYSDRNLYRPGDTLHFSAILRKWDMTPPKDLPLFAKIFGPAGNNLQELKKNTNAQGSFEFDFPIDERMLTGSYHVEVFSGTGENMGSYEFQVEEFVPDKIKVTLTTDKPKGIPGDTVRLPIEAAYYFGSVCDDHTYDGRLRIIYSAYPLRQISRLCF
jgi:alpha-2-macroglobulin